MKKWLTSFMLLILTVALPLSTENVANAADCSQYAGVSKIYWNGTELKNGQIGRLNVLKDTPLYKLNGENKSFSRTLKKGEFYRIYAFKPGMLSVGGGYYINRDDKIKYETPSKTKLEAVKCINQPKDNPKTTTDESVTVQDITKNNDQPVDPSKSIIKYLYFGENNTGNLVYDVGTRNYRFLPLKVSGINSSASFGTKDAVYFITYNNQRNTMNSWDLYRTEINPPFTTTKVMENIGYVTSDGSNLYSIEVQYVVENGIKVEKGNLIYKTDMFGNNKQLVKELPGYPMIFNNSINVKNDSLYVTANNTSVGKWEVYKLPKQGGELELKAGYHAEGLTFSAGQEFIIYYTSRQGKVEVFDPKTETSFTFTGPEPHDNKIAEVYNNKFYYVTAFSELYEVDKNGTIKKLTNPTTGEIIGIIDNYLIILDGKQVKKVKFI